MGFFKVRNITSTLSKRDSRINTPQTIELTGTFSKSNVVLPPNAEFVFESNFLPVQLHKMRVENVISVLEISRDEYMGIVSINESVEKASVKKTKSIVQEKKETVKKEVLTQNEEKKTSSSKQQSKNFV